MKTYKVTITQERFLKSIDSYHDEIIELYFDDYPTAYVFMEMVIEHAERTKCCIETIEMEEEKNGKKNTK